MAKKEKKATEILNVELAAIDSCLTVALTFASEDSPIAKILKDAQARCEAARDALLTIQFHAAQI